MDAKEILKFCLENGLLVDKEVLALFSEESDTESVKLIIGQIKNKTQRKIITKDIFYESKEGLDKLFLELPRENKEVLEKIKIKLGLSIEISKEISASKKIQIADKKTALGSLDGVKIISAHCLPGKKFGVEDFVSYFRKRFSDMKGFLQNHPSLENLVSINKLSDVKQGVSLIGMVLDKKTTKNKNIILEIEDLTGRTSVLVSKGKEDLVKKAEDVALDSVIGFKCSGNKEILFANDIIFPEIGLISKKNSTEEEYVAFIGDIHYGSKNFLRENFLKFIDYLNGKIPNTPEVKKIKYLFILGDLITGIGVYPNQEKDLAVVSLEDQYIGAAELISKIRKDIKIIISPGNHEGVRLMEPQPLYDEKYAWALYDIENVILTENPVWVNVGAKENFPGFNVLVYHGFSYPFYADNVPKLVQEKAMNAPEKIIKHLLMHRHLAPTHGSVQYFPGEDIHLIKQAPDIIASGHTHKSGVVYYNNILIISCSAWESLTPYQEKFGNTPDFCKVPILNLKTREVKILDFE